MAFVIIYYILDIFIKTEGFVKVVFLFILFAFLYYLGLPIEMTLMGTSLGGYGFISDRVLIIITSMGVLSIAGFMLGFKISNYRFHDIKSFELVNSRFLFFSLLLLFVFSSVILFVLFKDSLLSSISSYAGNVSETYNNPIYAYLKEIFISSTAILILMMTLKRGWYLLIAMLLSLTLIIFGIITSDKDPLLLSALAWGIYFFKFLSNHNLHKVITYLMLLIILVVLIPALSLLFSLNRGGNINVTEFKNQIETNGIYKYFDATGPLVSLVETLEEPNVDFEYGKTYFWGFVGWIPKSVWTNRPLDLAEKYSKEKIKNWQPGQGLGYSLLTEAYINFGVAGALIQYCLIGLLIGLIGRLHQWLFREPIAPFIFFIWMSYNIAIMHRGPFNLPSTYLRFVLPILFCYYSLYFSSIIWKKWKSIK